MPTPTPFSWKAGPGNVQISGDWDEWKERVALDKQPDGTFAKQISLPSNTKVHYKYIVDEQWTTNPESPTVNDGGNVNNVVDVGPEPATTTAAHAVEGALAGVGAAAAAVTAMIAGTDGEHAGPAPAAAASQTEGQAHAAPKTEAEKKQEPASGIKEVADGDVRNAIPPSLTSATHTAAPVVASAVATVTGADILRGTPSDALPVSSAEQKQVQADAVKGDNAALANKVDPVGGASATHPSQATTENAASGANVAATAASSNNLSQPPVAVNESGFAANVDPATGGLQTAGADKKEGGDKAAAIAAGSAGALGAAAVGGGAASLAGTKSSGGTNVTNTDATTTSTAATTAPSTAAAPAAASAPAPGLGATDGAAAAVAATPDKSLPDAPTDVNKQTAPGAIAPSNGKTSAPAQTESLSSKQTPSGAIAPAGASTTTAAAVRNSTTAGAAPAIPGAATTKADAAAATTTASTTNGTGSKPKPAAEAPQTPSKSTSESKRTSKFGTLGARKPPTHDSYVDASQDRRQASEATSQRDRKKSFFGKIKAAISPHSSPSK